MTLDEVREIVRSKLPNRLTILIDLLDLTISVHPPEEQHMTAVVYGGPIAYIYATDSPGGDPPWRSTKYGLEAGDIVGDSSIEEHVIDCIDSICLAFLREKKHMAVVNDTSSWEEFQERVGGCFNNKQAYDAMVERRDRMALRQ